MAENFGPLPWYGWAGIGAIGIGGYMDEKKKMAAAAAADVKITRTHFIHGHIKRSGNKA